MNHLHTCDRAGPGPLDLRELAQFDAALAGVPEEEKRRKRIAYLREATRQIQMSSAIMEKSGCLFIPFAIIPFFWPVLWFARMARRKTMENAGAQLNAALDYWNLTPVDIARD